MASQISFTQEQLDLMKQMHEEGMLHKDIAIYFNTSSTTINRKLSNMGVPSRHPRITQERKDRAIELYKQYHNLKRVEKELRMNSDNIHSILNEAGIHVLTMAEVKSTCHINTHYFDYIDTPRKSYYLGLLYADGCATSTKHGIYISLQEQDKHILDSFIKDTECTYKLRFIDYKKKNPNYSNQYSLSITNREFYNSLVKLGMIPNKSLSLEFPSFLSTQLIPSFLLGYMDGDGSINKKEGRCMLIGTESFCTTVAKIVKEKLNVHASISLCHGKKDSPTRECRISGRKQAKKFLDWLYSNSDIWLDRKYQSYQEMCRRKNNL